LTATGCSTYTWSSYNNTVIGTNSSIVQSPTVTTYYQVQGTDSYGCVSNPTSGEIIIGNPAFLVSTVNKSYYNNADTIHICTAYSETLTASGATSFTWMPGGVNTNTFVALSTPT